jgi:hypothetical protein
VEKVVSKLAKTLTSRRDKSNSAIGVSLKLLQKVKKVHKVLVAEDVYYPVKVKLQNTYLFY